MSWPSHPGATMSELASAVKIGRATLNRHFKTRDQLIHAVAMSCVEAIDEAVAEAAQPGLTDTEKLQAICTAIAPLGGRFHFLAVAPPEIDDTLRAEVNRQFASLHTLLAKVQSEGGLRSDASLWWGVYAFDALIYAVWSAVNDGYVARNDAGQLLFNTFLSGLGPTTNSPSKG